jgi:hypothetical protein
MAAAFGARRLVAALVVLLDFIDSWDQRLDWAFSTINAADSKWTTKAAPSQGAAAWLEKSKKCPLALASERRAA